MNKLAFHNKSDTINYRLKELRARGGVTQTCLARRVGCSQAYLSRVERGEAPDSSEVCILKQRIASYFNVLVSELFPDAGDLGREAER
jgi:transcriptional regulator with XRE-family HTH domain